MYLHVPHVPHTCVLLHIPPARNGHCSILQGAGVSVDCSRTLSVFAPQAVPQTLFRSLLSSAKPLQGLSLEEGVAPLLSAMAAVTNILLTHRSAATLLPVMCCTCWSLAVTAQAAVCGAPSEQQSSLSLQLLRM